MIDEAEATDSPFFGVRGAKRRELLTREAIRQMLIEIIAKLGDDATLWAIDGQIRKRGYPSLAWHHFCFVLDELEGAGYLSSRIEEHSPGRWRRRYRLLVELDGPKERQR
jgi:hypothetical protein